VAQWGGTVTKWKHTVKMTDEEGRIYRRPYEVDIVVVNGKIMLVEMKGRCDLDGIERFLECVEQYVYKEKSGKPVEKVIITFDASGPAMDKAEEEGITIIMPTE
jgi:hypothetical protein